MELTESHYSTPVRLRGYSTAVSAYDAHSVDDALNVFRANLRATGAKDPSKEQHAQIAHRELKDLIARRQEYMAALDEAAQVAWGRPYRFADYRISGAVNDDFSEEHKERLRQLERAQNESKLRATMHARAAGKGAMGRVASNLLAKSAGIHHTAPEAA